MERIARAAVRYNGHVFAVDPPGRHHDVLHEMARQGFGIECGWDQGFVTSTGRYVRRRRACSIARKAGQITMPKKTNPQDELFSEDLW